MPVVGYSTAVKLLVKGQLGVLPTDTLYGLVTPADQPTAVERVYRVKGRSLSKPCIVLIAGWTDLERLGRPVTDQERQLLSRYWPGPVSIALDYPEAESEHLHRGLGSLAFRMPADERLRDLLEQTGPLVAPSANPEGMAPARTVAEAENYFGRQVDFYVDAGRLDRPASTLIKLQSDEVVTVRG